MSISYQQIVQKIKEEVDSIQPGETNATIRAKMEVIRSLASLITEDQPKEAGDARSAVKTSYSIDEAEAKVMGIPKETIQRKQNTNPKLDEPDANGDSIFDF